MDELRKRLNLVIVGTAEARCADDGDGYVDVWVTNIEETVDAVLAEIGTTHVIVSLEDAEIVAAARSLFDEPTEWDDIQVNQSAAGKLLRLLGKE
jgi:hypothetical protein